MNDNLYPRLRPVEAQWIEQQGQPALLLQDRLALGARAIVVPQLLAPLLALCDGTRDLAALRAGHEVRTGVRLDAAILEKALAQLDEALFLDNRRYAEAYRQALESYRSAPFREAMLAGDSYPAQDMELRAVLDRYLEEAAGQHNGRISPPERLRGLISPHIDYDRGGLIYAGVWDLARESIAETDLVVILGTDHGGGPAEVTLTRQHYQTPLGLLPTAVEAVEEVAEAMGADTAFGSELNHRPEHSIELAAVWLRHLAGHRDLRVLPVLCGSFHPFTHGGEHPSQHETWAAAAAALRGVVERRRALVVAAADLAHVGPAFGDPNRIGRVERSTLATADAEMLGAISRGDAEGFLDLLAREKDQRKVCGLPPIYLALKILGDVSGEVVDYSQCPAPGGSVVSVAGVLWQ